MKSGNSAIFYFAIDLWILLITTYFYVIFILYIFIKSKVIFLAF